jgi:hypothetical protein
METETVHLKVIERIYNEDFGFSPGKPLREDRVTRVLDRAFALPRGGEEDEEPG